MIKQLNLTTFELSARGNEMTLKWNDTYDCWEMLTVNASTRAYNGVMPSIKFFDSLEQVEKKYKSWRGIVALAGYDK